MGLSIMKPHFMTVGQAIHANILTPSPREIWQAAAAGVQQSILIDLGSDQPVDMIYIGGTNADAATTITCYKVLDAASSSNIGTIVSNKAIRLPLARSRPFNAAYKIAAPVTGRYFRIYISAGQTSKPIQIGNIALGAAFSHPYSFGPGRSVIDTSRRTEFIDGGFGIEPGARKAGFRWTFVDLNEAKLDILYQIARDCGSSSPIIVMEDDSLATPKATQIHYGLFDRLDAFERLDPKESRWVMGMTEWV